MLNLLIWSIRVFVVALICIISIFNGITLFTWHPVLMSAGLLLFMSESIGAFTNERTSKYGDRVTSHWTLHLGALTLISIAFWSIYTHKNNNNYDHFASRHASLGFTALLFMVGTTFGGIFAKYSGAIKKTIKPAYMKIIHSTFGVLTYTLASCVFYLGLDTAWFRGAAGEQMVTILQYAVGLVTILALARPLIALISKVRNATKSRD